MTDSQTPQTPQSLLPDAIGSLPEVEAARLQFERADARLEYHLETPTFLRMTAAGRGRTAQYTSDRRLAQDALDAALREVWRMVPHSIIGDSLRVHVFSA